MRWTTSSEAGMREFRRRLASSLPLGEKGRPYSSGQFKAPDKFTTLAGMVAAKLYGLLTLREKPKRQLRPMANFAGRRALGRFYEALKTRGAKLHGQTGRNAGFFLHLDEKGYAKLRGDFLFGYQQDISGRRELTAVSPMRVYVTIGSAHANSIGEHFVRMASKLLDSGVRFDAKAGTPDIVRERKDNMVFYVHPEDFDAAHRILGGYLQKEGIGARELPPAIPGNAAGLSWALEPSTEDRETAKEISGSYKQNSHTDILALALTGDYLTRLAEAHKMAGNGSEAKKFEKEAERVRRILEE